MDWVKVAWNGNTTESIKNTWAPIGFKGVKIRQESVEIWIDVLTGNTLLQEVASDVAETVYMSDVVAIVNDEIGTTQEEDGLDCGEIHNCSVLSLKDLFFSFR